MTYAYQTFSSGQVLTGGQAQQIEDNVRDHVHGKDGVGATGIAFQVSSRGAAFSVVSTDAGKLIQCYGDFPITFPTAGSLGGSFGSTFKNCGSGRVALNAASGQYIEGNSCYALAPGEQVTAQVDVQNQLQLIGAQHGIVRLARFIQGVSSFGDIELKHCYPEDFQRYHIRARPVMNASGIFNCTISLDSGSSYLASGYSTSMGGETTQFRLIDGGANSTQAYSEFSWCNVTSKTQNFRGWCVRGATYTDPWTAANSNPGAINAIKISPATSFGSGTIIELYGEGRVRAVV